MKLFYQSMGVARRSESGPYARALAKVLPAAAAPGTEVDVFGLSPGKAIADQYRYLEYLDTAEVLDNGLRAEKEGYDAFLIGNVFEPGPHALREVLNIPVLGLAHAGVHTVDGVPIVNGLIARLTTAEMAVQIRRLTGGFTSKRMMYAPPTGKLLADIRAAYGDHVYPGAV